MSVEKKKKYNTGDPDHRQAMSLESIDRSFTDLISVLTSISSNHPDMRAIINMLHSPMVEAKKWVLEV